MDEIEKINDARFEEWAKYHFLIVFIGAIYAILVIATQPSVPQRKLPALPAPAQNVIASATLS